MSLTDKYSDQRARQTEVTNNSDGIKPPIITLFSDVTSSVIAASATKLKSNPVSFVCDFHDRLCEWGKSLNSLYSIQILLCTGISSIVVVVYLYIFYLMLSRNEKYKLNIRDCHRLLSWGLWYFSMIFWTSYICAKTRDEVLTIFFSVYEGFHKKVVLCISSLEGCKYDKVSLRVNCAKPHSQP